MVFHIKTTLNIDDTVMAKLREQAARRGRTMSELVEAGLRLVLKDEHAAPATRLPPLPSFNFGRHAVDVADRDALYQVMEDR